MKTPTLTVQVRVLIVTWDVESRPLIVQLPQLQTVDRGSHHGGHDSMCEIGHAPRREQEGALLRTMTRLSDRQHLMVYYGNGQCRCVMSRYHKCIVALAVCVPYNNPNRAIGPERSSWSSLWTRPSCRPTGPILTLSSSNNVVQPPGTSWGSGA